MYSVNGRKRRVVLGRILAIGAILICLSGCSTLTFPIRGIPTEELSGAAFARPKRDLVPIDVSLLAQRVPESHRIDEGDTLGLVVDGVLPFSPEAQVPVLPPVHYPEGNSNLPPAIGVPVVVQQGGVVTLPIVGRVELRGRTLAEAAELIFGKYKEKEVLRKDASIPTVTLIHPRTINVTVIREDTGESSDRTNYQDAHGGIYRLPAYRNDVLNALMVSGGLPGLRAKNEVRVYRRPKVGELHSGVMIDSDELPAGAVVVLSDEDRLTKPAMTIPLRVASGTPVSISPTDVILNEGDIVYIANRDTEVFYTGGLLPAGEHLLPRDYDIDVFEAMAIAGYSVGGGSSGGGGGLGPASTGVAPTALYIFRDCGNGEEFTIEVDLKKAMQCSRDRLLIRSGDKLLLRYTACEETLNFGIFSFFTFGIRQLFQN